MSGASSTAGDPLSFLPASVVVTTETMDMSVGAGTDVATVMPVFNVS